ncbi:hypothetical protein ACVWYG_002047 [Pedobacter sp. UYEF25]
MESYNNSNGILFLLIGVFIRYQIGKRRFDRRNITGLQIYSSYLKALMISIIEKLLNFFGVLCIVLGLIAIVIMH